MSQKSENTGFTCQYCGQEVLPLTNGSYRNHCPFCLCSKHVDIYPGDRESECGGKMNAVEVVYKSGKGYQLVHECQSCGHRQRNKVASDTVQPDNDGLILELMSNI